MPEVLKSSMSKNTFKSYTVGLKKNGPSCAKKFRLTVFQSVSQNYLMLFISDLIDKQALMAVLNNVLYSLTWVHQICIL